MCGNPRKSTGRPTRQEEKAALAARQELRELNVPERFHPSFGR